jgi:hypothetical protein
MKNLFWTSSEYTNDKLKSHLQIWSFSTTGDLKFVCFSICKSIWLLKYGGHLEDLVLPPWTSWILTPWNTHHGEDSG